MNSKKRILVAPLDWGLGHASRCIPIANALEHEGFEVVFAASGRTLNLLLKEFPNNDFIKLDGYNVHYPKNGNMAWSMLSQSLKIIKGIRREHALLQEIIKDYNIDGVISDSRFGLYSDEVPCVFISHQLNIQAPVFADFIQKINFKYIQKFDECWVPDDKNHSLSGLLSKVDSLPFKCRFIGALSRFEQMPKTDDLDILAIVSGPEPQRSLLEDLLKKQLIESDQKALLVLGKTEEEREEQLGNLRIVSHLNAKALNQAMVNAKVVISRSGYSTIMDLAVLNKKAIFIPTIGQTEQLYLAKFFYDKKLAFAMHQKELDVLSALKSAEDFRRLSYNHCDMNWRELLSLFKGK